MTRSNVTVNIDAGGTFTDGLATYQGATETAKVPTTQHDLTVCFIECIEALAGRLDVSVPDLLGAADAVRFSTTVGTNAVIEKTGPVLGLLVTAGAETSLYGDGDERTVADAFVDRELVQGIEEEVTPDGEVVESPDPAAVTRKVKELQERGARLIVIALANAYANDENERRVKQLIDEEYPRQYIGSVPTLASFEVSSRPDDYGRLNTVTINAYIHRPMKSTLYRAEDNVRDRNHDRPLLIAHSNGGVARVAKTMALNTYNSGPAAGSIAAHALADLYGEDIAAVDMGGTSVDISQARTRAYQVQLTPWIDGLPTHVPAIEVHTAGAGGGSIAAVSDGTLRVGPESAGANPGPACFGRGGTEATVTDADVVLGRVDPNYFLGGEFELSADRAYEAIEENVARPLGVDVAVAAERVSSAIESEMAATIEEVIDPAVDTLTAYGGAAPVHAVGFSSGLDVDRVVVPPHSSVFSAFGESTMDVRHTYTRPLPDPDGDEVAAGLEALRSEAVRDMRAEGYAVDEIEFAADVLVYDGDGGATERPIEASLDATDPVVEELSGRSCTLRLHATGEAPKAGFETHDLQAAVPAEAEKEPREVYWGEGYEETRVFQREALLPGNEITGPVIVEATDTTITVPRDDRFTIDEYGHGLIE